MGCFSPDLLKELLIWLVVIIAAFAIIRVLLGLVSPPPEFAGAIGAAIAIVRIVLWVVVTIAIIVVVFDLLACAIGLPRLH